MVWGVQASNLSSCPPSLFFSFLSLPHFSRENWGRGSSRLSRTRATVLTMEKLTFAAFQTHVGKSTL